MVLGDLDDIASAQSIFAPRSQAGSAVWGSQRRTIGAARVYNCPTVRLATNLGVLTGNFRKWQHQFAFTTNGRFAPYLESFTFFHFDRVTFRIGKNYSYLSACHYLFTPMVALGIYGWSIFTLVIIATQA
jgi:hypothetical protein